MFMNPFVQSQQFIDVWTKIATAQIGLARESTEYATALAAEWRKAAIEMTKLGTEPAAKSEA